MTIDALRQDVPYALRTMRKNPAFAVTAALTLALGIGGNTTIFTVIRAVLLKPLAYRDPDRLVRVTLASTGKSDQDTFLSLGRYENMRTAARSFTALGAAFATTEDMTLAGETEPEALKGARVSANFLAILGVEPLLGRSFLEEEDRRGGRPVAMISASAVETPFRRRPIHCRQTGGAQFHALHHRRRPAAGLRIPVPRRGCVGLEAGRVLGAASLPGGTSPPSSSASPG